jgi:hypothetical protein
MKRKPTSFSLDRELVRRVRDLQTDPLTGRTRYGSMSRLIEALLWAWVKNEQGQVPNPKLPDPLPTPERIDS